MLNPDITFMELLEAQATFTFIEGEEVEFARGGTYTKAEINEEIRNRRVAMIRSRPIGWENRKDWRRWV